MIGWILLYTISQPTTWGQDNTLAKRKGLIYYLWWCAYYHCSGLRWCIDYMSPYMYCRSVNVILSFCPSVQLTDLLISVAYGIRIITEKFIYLHFNKCIIYSMFILFIIYRTLNLAFLPIPFTWMYIVNMKNARNYDACKIETFKPFPCCLKYFVFVF